MELVYLGVVAGLIALTVWAARRHTQLFVIRVTEGRAKIVRGKVAPSFFTDVKDLTRHVKEGTVSAIREGGEPRLVLSSSIDERTAQRLRNAFAVHPGKQL
ncbi:MAG: DUF3634 family protein [Deltaproteobacteria bacterium]|nr:DUF3634 family protein [Deltaproteobacteria bacterium]